MPAPGWFGRLFARTRRHAPLKAVGTTVYITAFFVAYFWLLENPRVPPTVMPLTALDRAVPFSTVWLPAYLSLWLYVSLPPAFIETRRALVGYGIAIGAVCVLGLGSFVLWPTAVPPHLVDLANTPEMALLQGIDATGNACPSMHVATALFSGLWLHRLLAEVGAPRALRLANLLWGVAIVYSTLAIKQHVAIDMLGGLVLGGLGAWGSLAWYGRLSR
ncbi:phosphatase PAP2 family protein [Nitrogeniibacter mangrovi]|uniref:Phosphatase PAP2 family protein n=1 Tax=Nitrogeniibacter mangrovi TaxID=2016596 RepID=A0A6C1B7E3_9RHOO|nr:phosphatase PAP2 family protein [Nitrogeniibacter mangrovi]